MNLVDTNVWIDIINNDPTWKDWSLRHLKLASATGGICINPVIYAELATRYTSREQLDAALGPTGVQMIELSPDAAFLAGHAFLRYRQSKGTKSGVLPDFFIGAQAQAQGFTLVTRDAARFRSYFPRVNLLAP